MGQSVIAVLSAFPRVTSVTYLTDETSVPSEVVSSEPWVSWNETVHGNGFATRSRAHAHVFGSRGFFA